jgi:acetyl esterase
VALTRQARELVDQLQSMGDPVETLSPEQARRASDERRAHSPVVPEPIAEVVDRSIDGPVGPLAVRVYRPDSSAALPVLVFFHGGGWVLCDLDSHDPICRKLANEIGCVVVSVDYRRAPESRYPAAVQDAYAATAWVAGHADELGVDADRLMVMGDSSGGNLAAAVALLARDRGGPRIAGQVLVYPVTDHRFDTGSHRDFGTDHYLTTAAMRWYWDHYAPEPIDREQPYLSPLCATDLSGLPPALIVSAECDPLRDEGVAYARRLRDAGTEVEQVTYKGMFHGFFTMTATLDGTHRAVSDVVRALRQRLALDAVEAGTRRR